MFSNQKNTSGHGKKVCRYCGIVTSQCRCGCNSNIAYIICDTCAKLGNTVASEFAKLAQEKCSCNSCWQCLDDKPRIIEEINRLRELTSYQAITSIENIQKLQAANAKVGTLEMQIGKLSGEVKRLATALDKADDEIRCLNSSLVAAKDQVIAAQSQLLDSKKTGQFKRIKRK